MSFDKDRWSRQSVALNTGAYTLADASVKNGPAVFTYNTATDDIETVEGLDYFADAAWDLAVGDLILARTSQGFVTFEVATVTRGDSPSVSLASTPLSGIAPIKTVDLTLTSAQLLALRATPITVVAAPGAKNVVHFLSAVLSYDFGTTAYTIANAADDFVFRMKDGTGVVVSEDVPLTGFVDQLADHIAKADHLATSNGTAANMVNQPLVIHNNSGVGELTLGDGLVHLRVQYRIVGHGLS